MAKAKSEKTEECFAIMPITEVDGYAPGHFQHVFDDIIKPACTRAGFAAIRADEVKAANLIHLDILRKLIETPVAVCDLSTRNPNVLFELGVRQAFDMPVVLIQEKGTIPIFDIAPLRYLEYSREMKYHEVLESQQKLADAITATMKAGGGNVNSIVKLLGLQSGARVPELAEQSKESLAFEVLQAEMSDIRKMIQVLTLDQSVRSSAERVPRVDLDLTAEALLQELNSLWSRLSDGNGNERMVASWKNGIRSVVKSLFKTQLNNRQLSRFKAIVDEITAAGHTDLI